MGSIPGAGVTLDPADYAALVNRFTCEQSTAMYFAIVNVGEPVQVFHVLFAFLAYKGIILLTTKK